MKKYDLHMDSHNIFQYAHMYSLSEGIFRWNFFFVILSESDLLQYNGIHK